MKKIKRSPEKENPLRKKNLLSLLATLLFTLFLGGCQYNDDALWNEIDGIKKELEAVKSQISSLEKLVDAINTGKTITQLTETEAGYTVTFNDGTTMEIKHGKDGIDAPEIGIALFEDTYYWTKGTGSDNWLTDASGHKIPVSGTNGADGITPQLKIENDYWYVSVDNGATWQQLDKSTSPSNSLFTEVRYDDNYAYFVLADGTELKVAMATRLKIELSATSLVMEAGKEMEISYQLLHATGQVQVEVISCDVIKARVSDRAAAQGTIYLKTTNLDAIDEYTKVVVLATDDVRAAMATITFDKEEGVLRITETYEATADKQLLSVLVETNLDSYDIEIEEAAQAWISKAVPQSRAIREEEQLFSIEANTTPAIRSGLVTFTGGGLERVVSIVQLAAAVTPDPEPETPPVVGNVELDKLYGYGVGTTGGEGATAANIHHFNSGDSFREYLKIREKNKETTPAILYLSGTFTKEQGRDSGSPWFDIKDTHNLSIYGVDGFVMENVGLFMVRASNIIVRNIYIKQPKADNGADAISMQKSNNIWVDHCTFESMNSTKDYEDGSCDITHGTYNVTVSWCHFIKTQKSCLVGHSNSETADVQIRATFHHNFFDLSSSRHPRVRFGKVHVYNNYFNEVSTYGVGSAYGALVLVEDNYFDGVKLPTDICTYPAKPSGSSWVSNLTGSVAGYLYERGNEYANKPADANEVYPFTNVEYKAYNGEQLATPYVYADFKPEYDYLVDAAEALPAIVSSSSGTGKLSQFAQAPIEVDNGGITVEPSEPETPEEGGPTGNDLGNNWKWLAYNDASVTPTVAGSALTVAANGKFEGGSQAFGYVYREVTGNFVAMVTVDSYATASTSNQSLAGLMIAPDVTTTATNFMHVMAAQGPDSKYYRSVRVAVANATRGTLTAPSNVDATQKPIMRVERVGDVAKISYSLDGGATFGSERSETFTAGLPETVCLGLAVSSGSSSATATALFDNFMLNGETVLFE